MSQIQIEEKFETGFPGNIFSTIIRRISSLTRRDKVSNFKIGITSTPYERARYHSRNFDRMVLLYRTSSYQNVTLLERLLISHNWEFSENIINGGGGRKGQPPFYLYVVLRSF